MSRYSYDDMPPEGYREKHRGSGRMTAAIASIGVLLTLIAVIIYLLFAPQKEASEMDPGRTSSIAVTPAQPEIIESMEQSVELPQASEAPREERIVAASDRFQQIPFTDYTVQDGDTLTSVAESFSLSTSTIVSVNGLTETTLEAGMVLRIPPVNGTLYEVEEGDTLSAIASMRNPELSASDLAALNGKPYTATTPDFAKGTILFDGRCNDIAKRIMSSKLGKVQPSMRVYGSACYSLAMVALHRGLAFVTTNKNLWDNTPGILLCLESNCKVLYRDDCTIVTSQDWIYDTLSNLL